jgi:hypothetical protein
MRLDNPIIAVAASLYSATMTDLPDIEYDSRSFRQVNEGQDPVKKKRRPSVEEVEIVMFPQMWSSTALGFGGMGGAAMTPAYTVVVFGQYKQSACVYFGGRLAYTIDKDIPKEFWEDVKNQRMPSVADAITKYEKNEKQ